jgi:hypothetical protein
MAAAGEEKMPFMLHMWKVYVSKKREWSGALFITGSRQSGSRQSGSAPPAAFPVEKVPRILRHNWSHILLAGLAGLAR